jgi:hypothetical protein
VRLPEHRHSFQQGLLEKLTIAKPAYEEGHRIDWDNATILETESKSGYRK